jgi:hypothetical protein
MACAGLLASTTAVGAMPAASAARSCPSFTEITHRSWGSFKIRVHNIAARVIHCGGADYVIRQFDKNLPPGPGIYTGVGPWQCRAFRPFGGPDWMWNSDCKRGDQWIDWIENQLSRS